MLITSQPTLTPNTFRGLSSNQTPGGPGGPEQPKPEQTMVERIVDKTYLGANYTASGISGTIGGLGAYGRSVLPATVKATGSFYKNFIKAETIGPNIKILGSLVAGPLFVAGAVLGLPISAGVGLYQGADEVDSSKPRQFTIGAAGVAGYKETREGWTELTDSAIKSFEEMGNDKLAEGEKPFDIPLIKTVKTVAVGAAAAAIGGVAGVASFALGTAREAAVGVVRSFADDRLHLGGKLLGSAAALVGAPVHGAVYGAGTFLSITGNAIATTWDKDSLVKGASSALSGAKNSVFAAVAPESTLLQEKPQPPQA
jgi:hypothetical protein